MEGDSAIPVVADTYPFVAGVDTRAATPSCAIITCPTGAVVDQQVFLTAPAGLRCARPETLGRLLEGRA